MIIEKLENNIMFEVGGIYSYAFACNSDSYHSIQVVSISPTRKTAMICDYYGKDVDPKSASRKKIDMSYSGDCEAISAGRYSMAGSWYATERSYSKRRDDFDVNFMLETEAKDDLKRILADFPTDSSSVYTVKLVFWVNNYVIRDFNVVSLSAAVNYLNEKSAELSATYNDWHVGYTVYKNGSPIDGDYTSKNNPAALLDTIERNSHYYEFENEYFNMLMTCGAEALPSDVMEELTELAESLGFETSDNESERRAEITMTSTEEPDPDPDNDPSGKPDKNTLYSDFDNNFRQMRITNITFSGCKNAAAEPAERAKKTNHKKKLTEKEWKKQLEMKAKFEATEKAAKLEKISAQLRNAQIGDKIIDLETPDIIERITSIDREDCNNEPEYFVIKTDYNNVYEGFDFFDDCTTGDPATVIFATSSEPEQADPEQLDFDSCGGSAARPATVPLCPIDEDAAKRGKESYSFSSYVPGSATAAYTAQVERVAAAADKIKPQLTAEDSTKLDRLVNRYAAKLADWTNRKNRCDASYPSWMISGPANYNMRKHEKQMSRLDKLFAEYAEIEQLENKILNFAAVDHPIMSGDENALDKLREKVAELTACREKMKQENAAARKQGKNLPHPSWELSNSLQNLNRYKERLAALEKAKASETSEQITADGVKIVRNTDLMRLQLIFDGKPSDEVRAVLKKNAFKWSTKNSAWQRQLTPNAERSLETVLKAIK